MSDFRPLEAAARSHKKSPENAICSHPIGEVCANKSTGTIVSGVLSPRLSMA